MSYPEKEKRSIGGGTKQLHSTYNKQDVEDDISVSEL